MLRETRTPLKPPPGKAHQRKPQHNNPPSKKKHARAAVYQSTQRKARLDEASLVKILDTNGGQLCTDLFQAVAPNSADLIDPGVSCLKRQTKSTIVPQSRAATYTSQICYLAKLQFCSASPSRGAGRRAEVAWCGPCRRAGASARSAAA